MVEYTFSRGGGEGGGGGGREKEGVEEWKALL